MKIEDIITDRVTVACVTGYCPECEEGTIVPFVRAKEAPAPALLILDGLGRESYWAAVAAVDAWKAEHVQTAHSAALAAV